ncbi:hypothetical protein ACH5RR_017467 [Cinchona calisaya]|uniref:Cystatin domain-containing protein n=1 Tax=Cinchona calisaya TaxID=153742 RepID=A0ABD2ZNK8_9GENT
MAYNSHYLLLLTIPAVVCLFFDLPSPVLGSGVWQVVDPTDLEALANAKFAIDEHNKVPESKLLFESIFKAEKQVLEKGTIYRIVIQATKSTGSVISSRDFVSSSSLFATSVVCLFSDLSFAVLASDDGKRWTPMARRC